jgi:hypothetical protein
MSKLFEKYQEQNVTTDESVKPSKKQVWLTKREAKALKMFAKQLKKCRKRWKQVEKVQTAEKEKNEDRGNGNREDKTNSEGKEESKNQKNFLTRLGDTFLKVFPSILRTVAQVAVPAIFGHIFKWRRSTT